MKEEGRRMKEEGVENSMGGKLIAVPISKTELTLDKLLVGVTVENLHCEIDIDEIVGNEELVKTDYIKRLHEL